MLDLLAQVRRGFAKLRLSTDAARHQQRVTSLRAAGHARMLAGCSLVAWAGWVAGKQEVLHRAMRWWAHHKMLSVADGSSSLLAPSDVQQGV